MTGRERMEAALSAGGSPEVPVFVPYEDICFRDHVREVAGPPWWWSAAPELERQAEWRDAALAAIGHDAVMLPHGTPASERGLWVSLERDGVPILRNPTTGEERTIAPEPAGGWHSAFAPESQPANEEEVDRAAGEPPEVDPSTLDLARAMLARRPDLYPYRNVGAPFWMCYYLWGFEGLMETSARRPDLVRHGCERMLRHSVAALKGAREAGARGIWIEDCMSDMLGPRAYGELALPPLQAMMSEARGLGLQTILYFCGDPWPVFRHLMASGADALALEESKKGFFVDIAEVVEEVDGRMAVFGNVDAMDLLQNGDDVQVAAEVERQLLAGRRTRGRFVLSLGSPVTPATPLAHVRRFCDMARQPR